MSYGPTASLSLCTSCGSCLSESTRSTHFSESLVLGPKVWKTSYENMMKTWKPSKKSKTWCKMKAKHRKAMQMPQIAEGCQGTVDCSHHPRPQQSSPSLAPDRWIPTLPTRTVLAKGGKKKALRPLVRPSRKSKVSPRSQLQKQLEIGAEGIVLGNDFE